MPLRGGMAGVWWSQNINARVFQRIRGIRGNSFILSNGVTCEFCIAVIATLLEFSYFMRFNV